MRLRSFRPATTGMAIIAAFAMVLSFFCVNMGSAAADPLDDVFSESVDISFLPGNGEGSMNDLRLTTTAKKIDTTTGNVIVEDDVPTTTLPPSRMSKDDAVFIGWHPVNDSVILPDQAQLEGLSYIADTNNDGQKENFDLSNSVRGGKLLLIAEYDEPEGTHAAATTVTEPEDTVSAQAARPQDTRPDTELFPVIPTQDRTPRTVNELTDPFSIAKAVTPFSGIQQTPPRSNLTIPTWNPANDHPQADGTTIEKIEASWITNDAGKDTLTINPPSTNTFNAKLRIDLSTSGQYAYEPGDIEIHLPKNIFVNRSGQFEGVIEMSVPADPSTKQTFNYRIVGNEVILTNTKRIAAASNNYFEINFKNLHPVDIVSGAEHGDFRAHVSITTHNGDTVTKTSNPLTAVVNTDEVVTEAHKRGDVYEYLPAAWNAYIDAGKLPQGFKAEDYVFVDWYTYAYITGNQPFTMAMEDPIIDDGILLGGTLSDQTGKELYASDNLFTGWTGNGNKFYHHIYVAYPLKKFLDSPDTYVHNKVTYTLTTTDTKHVTTASAEAKLTYVPYEYRQPDGHFGIHKWGVDEDGHAKNATPGSNIDWHYGRNGSVDDHRGYYNYGLNQLRDGNPTEVDYTIVATNMSYPWTCEPGHGITSEDGCGIRNVDFTIADQDTYWFNDFQTPLTQDDFEFSKLEIGNPIMYSFGRLSSPGLGYDDDDFSKVTWVEAGSWGYRQDTDVPVPDYTISAKDGNGTWTKVASVHWDGRTPTIIPDTATGASAQGRILHLPANTVDWKCEYSTNTAGHYLYLHPTVKLKATEHAIDYVTELYANSDTPTSLTRNTVTQQVSQDGHELGVSNRVSGEDWLGGVTQGSWLKKSGKQTGSNPETQTVDMHYTITVYNQSNLTVPSTYQNARNHDYIKDDPSGIYWDLLPLHVRADLSSIKVDDNSSIAYVKTHENWRGSGRTMLEIKIDHVPNATLIKSQAGGRGDGYGDVRNISFDASYSWLDMADYGEDLTNVVAYGSTADSLGTIKGLQGEPDDPKFGNNSYSKELSDADAQLLAGIGNPQGAHPSWLYGSNQLKLDATTMATTDLQKYVDVLNSNDWGDGLGANGLTVPEGGTYRYRLRLTADQNAQTKDLVFYDDIEAYVPDEDKKEDYGQEQWEGDFLDVDLSHLRAMGIKPVVYYAGEHVRLEQYKWGESDSSALQEIPDLHDTTVWSTVKPAHVKAIAIDCSKSEDGSDFVLAPGQSLNAYLLMRAPTGAAADDAIARHAYAFNNVYLSSLQVHDNGQTAKHYVHQEYTKLGLTPFQMTVRKAWDDAKDQDGKRAESVSVQLLKDGQPDAEHPQPVVLDASNNWTHTWSDLVYSHAEDGTPIDWSVREEPVDGYTTGIQSSMQADADEAVTQQVTVTNKHIPETVDIAGTKAWVADSAEQRPARITVVLYKDGKAFKETTATADKDWNYSFTNLPKYRDHGTQIVWSVKEKDYIPGYQSEVDGTTITNTYHPYADLKLTKTTVNQSEQFKHTQEFIFDFELFDASDNPITGDFDWTSSDGRSGTIQHGAQLRLKSGETITISTLPSESHYRLSEVGTAGYQVSASSNLDGTIRAGRDVEAAVENTYTATGTAAVEAGKQLTGIPLKRGQFRFELVDENDHVVRTSTNDKEGAVHFGALEYDQSQIGEHHYRIREVNTAKPGYQYDDHTTAVTVLVTDNGDGTLGTQVSYPDSEASATFRNAYHASGEVRLNAQKTLIGKPLEEGSFQFQVLDGDGQPVLSQDGKPVTATNKADGSVQFPPIAYTEQDIDRDNPDNNWRDYTIVEVDTKNPDIIYDRHTVAVRVRIADNGDGTITAETHITNPDELEWNNRLVNGTLAVQKTVTGEDADPNALFDFDVQLTAPAGIDIEDGTYAVTYEPISTKKKAPISTSTAQPQAPSASGTVYAAEDIASGLWGTCPWRIDSTGKLIVSAGTTSNFLQGMQSIPWNKYQEKITSAVFEPGVDTSGMTNLNYLFAECIHLRSVDLGSIDTSSVTNMQNMFYRCVQLTSIRGLEHFDTSKVTNMYSLFDQCSKLTTLDLSNFDTSKVTDMRKMFNNCMQLTSIRGLEHFDTSKVTSMYFMFYRCNSLAALDLSNFNTENVTSMQGMFYQCYSLAALDLSGFNTNKVTTMQGMFQGCTNLVQLDISNFDTSKIGFAKINNIFYNTPNLRRINIGENWFKASDTRTDIDTYPYNNSTSAQWVDEDRTIEPVTWETLANDWDSGAYPPGWYIVFENYTIRFHANGAKGQMQSIECRAAQECVLPANTFYWFNHDFTGWNTAADGSGTSYGNTGSIPKGKYTPGQEVDLYAQWYERASSVTITGGSFTIQVPAGYKAVITGIPGGVSYVVSERSKPGWVNTSASGSIGTIPPNGEACAAFVNDYRKNETRASLHAYKYLDGKAAQGNAFAFELVDSAGKVVQSVPNDGPNVLFDAITFTRAGEYRYTIRERRGDDAAIEYDGKEIAVSVRVTDDGQGHLSSAVTYQDDAQAFHNMSRPGSLQLVKRVDGTSTGNDKQFTFHVTLTDPEGGPVSDTFSGIHFNDAGEADIPVSQATPVTIAGLPAGTRWNVVESGTMPDGYATASGNQTGKVEAGSTVQATIVNTYAAHGDITLGATKHFNGQLESGQFAFELLDSTGTVVSTAYNGADGIITFDVISYDRPGMYEYTIREVDGADPAVDYDTTTHKVTVTVTDNGDGTLSASADRKADDVVFTNALKPGDVRIVKHSSTPTAKEFEFLLHLDHAGLQPYEAVKSACEQQPEETHVWLKDGDTFTLFAEQSLHIEGLPADTVVHAEEIVPQGFIQNPSTVDRGTVPAGGTLELHIDNDYHPQGWLELAAQKTLSGAALQDGQFEFAIKDEEGHTVSTARNSADGTIRFSPITYLEGDAGSERHYTMLEIDDAQPGITYDASAHGLTVTVHDDGKGTLTPVVQWDEPADADNGVGFRNAVGATLPETGGIGVSSRLPIMLLVVMAACVMACLLVLNRRGCMTDHH